MGHAKSHFSNKAYYNLCILNDSYNIIYLYESQKYFPVNHKTWHIYTLYIYRSHPKIPGPSNLYMEPGRKYIGLKD